MPRTSALGFSEADAVPPNATPSRSSSSAQEEDARQNLKIKSMNDSLTNKKAIIILATLAIYVAYFVLSRLFLTPEFYADRGLRPRIGILVNYVVPITTIILSLIPLYTVVYTRNINSAESSLKGAKLIMMVKNTLFITTFLLILVSLFGPGSVVYFRSKLSSSEALRELGASKSVTHLVLYTMLACNALFLLVNIFAMRRLITHALISAGATFMSNPKLMGILLGSFGLLSVGSSFAVSGVTGLLNSESEESLLQQYNNMSESEKAQFRDLLRQ